MTPEDHEEARQMGWQICTVVDMATGVVWDDVFLVREREVWSRDVLFATISNRAALGEQIAIKTLRHMVRSTPRKKK